MNKIEYTPGPWEYVASTEHHGPYVTSAFGSTICDCYIMSHPDEPSVRNGGKSKPVSFLHEMADPNARLIAAAPDLMEACASVWLMLAHTDDNELRLIADECRAAIAKAEG